MQQYPDNSLPATLDLTAIAPETGWVLGEWMIHGSELTLPVVQDWILGWVAQGCRIHAAPINPVWIVNDVN